MNRRLLSISSADPWRVGTFAIAALAFLPVLTILLLAFFPTENIWPHLLETTLPRYVKNTISLMTGVGVSVFVTGVLTAYLVTHFDFPFRKQFEWLLLLPLAVPAYVIAYVYTDLLEFAGPVQQQLRSLFGWKLATDYWFPPIRSMGGGIMVMGLVLYPYVYLMARASFLEQSSRLGDVSRLMGRGPIRTFFFVSLPVARPAISIGVALALMETLNDYGTVDFFAIQTLTAGLYDVWLGRGNLGGAAQIASVMLTFVLFLIALEYIGRRKHKFFQPDSTAYTAHIPHLTSHWRWLAVLACALPVIFGFIVPAWVLIGHAVTYFDKSWTPAFRQLTLNSLTVSFLAAISCVVLSVIVIFSKRLYKDKKLDIASRLASLGYAVPGAVLAVGIIVPFAAFDNTLDAFMRKHFDYSTGLILSGTIFALLFAYVARFLAISIGSIESSMGKISESIDMAARTLGYRPYKMLVRFHIPLIRSGVITAGLIVFVDCMKELPATLIMRPFNFETLATHVYRFASDEMIEKSALSALLIVLTGLIPVILLSRSITRSLSTK